MKSELKAKFLQHLVNKKGEQGFTLIELLVVIIIIGILSAIALPSFLNQANKARQSEAKTYVGSMNRAQQAYYLEQSNVFADNVNFPKLALGVATQTNNYKYSITGGGGGGTAAAAGVSTVVNRAEIAVNAAASPLKAYLGGVSAATVAGTNEASTLAVLAEGTSAPVNGGPQGLAADASEIAFPANAAPTANASTKYQNIK
jgi:type IV pilus assembly protein PilA